MMARDRRRPALPHQRRGASEDYLIGTAVVFAAKGRPDFRQVVFPQSETIKLSFSETRSPSTPGPSKPRSSHPG